MFPKKILHSHCYSPKPQIDWDSFCWPLIQELIQLEMGVKTFDVISQSPFLLHAYLILAFGDIPAIALIMCMKGQNGISACRICDIKGVCFESRTPYDKTRSLELILVNVTHLISISSHMRSYWNRQPKLKWHPRTSHMSS